MISKLLLPISLQILGVIVILAEFILPSAGILTITASLILIYSLYHAFTAISPEVGYIFVGIDAILIPVCILVGIKLIAHSPVTLKKSLSNDDGVIVQDANLAELVGKIGIVVNDLRPAGRALIMNKRYDVISGGDYIIKGSNIEVISVNSNRIVVKKIN